MKLTLPSPSTLLRLLLLWLGVILSFGVCTVTVALLILYGLRVSPVLRGIDPPNSTIITAIPQQLRLSEYTQIQKLHVKKTQQRRLLEGFTAHQFDPSSSLDAQ